MSVACQETLGTTVGVPVPAAGSTRTHRAAPPSSVETYCAWYAEPDGGVLYFGQSAFWSAFRRMGGQPQADLSVAGPRWIGRFDLRAERFLDPLDVAGSAGEALSGVWDVLPVGGGTGQVYFTTYFDAAGSLDLATGDVSTFHSAGRFLNELAAGPEPGQILASRYADAANGGGAVVLLDAQGRVLAEYSLPAPKGYALAAKTVAWDPIARQIWVTTDLLPVPDPAAVTVFPHPTLVLAADGREVERFGTTLDPLEIQFARFDSAGRGHLALVRGGRLELAVLAADAERRGLAGAERLLLDSDFPQQLDFAQDIHVAADDSVVVTRWSGVIHLIEPTGRLRSLQLPRSGDALYYSAVLEDGRLCATRCGEVEVVCTDSA
jgi:hypothetical protein